MLGDPPLAAQQMSAPEYVAVSEQARTALRERRFEQAVGLFDRLVRQNPRNGDPWLAYGVASRSFGRSREAIQAFLKVYELGYSTTPPVPVSSQSQRQYVALTIAPLHAGLGDRESALGWLDSALRGTASGSRDATGRLGLFSRTTTTRGSGGSPGCPRVSRRETRDGATISTFSTPRRSVSMPRSDARCSRRCSRALSNGCATGSHSCPTLEFP